MLIKCTPVDILFIITYNFWYHKTFDIYLIVKESFLFIYGSYLTLTKTLKKKGIFYYINYIYYYIFLFILFMDK